METEWRQVVMFKRFNIWYDRLAEPRRFFTFMLIAMPGFLIIAIAERTDNPEFNAIGLLYFCALLLVRVLGK